MLDKLPQVTEADDVKAIQQAFNKVERSAIMIEYGTEVPTKLGYGRLYVRDNGTTQGVYVKTGKGTIIQI